MIVYLICLQKSTPSDIRQQHPEIGSSRQKRITCFEIQLKTQSSCMASLHSLQVESLPSPVNYLGRISFRVLPLPLLPLSGFRCLRVGQLPSPWRVPHILRILYVLRVHQPRIVLMSAADPGPKSGFFVGGFGFVVAGGAVAVDGEVQFHLVFDFLLVDDEVLPEEGILEFGVLNEHHPGPSVRGSGDGTHLHLHLEVRHLTGCHLVLAAEIHLPAHVVLVEGPVVLDRLGDAAFLVDEVGVVGLAAGLQVGVFEAVVADHREGVGLVERVVLESSHR